MIICVILEYHADEVCRGDDNKVADGNHVDDDDGEDDDDEFTSFLKMFW